MKRSLPIFLLTLIIFSYSNTAFTSDQPPLYQAAYNRLNYDSCVVSSQPLHMRCNTCPPCYTSDCSLVLMLAETEVIQKKQEVFHESQSDIPQVIPKKQEVIHKIQGEESKVIQKKSENNIPLVLEPDEETKKKMINESLFKHAWQYYKEGNYNQAVKIFSKLSALPNTEAEAKYGMAMCYIGLNNSKKAVSLLEPLVNKFYDLKDTLPWLLTSLIDEGEFKRAEDYLPMLTKNEQEKWEETIKIKSLIFDFDRYKKAGRIDKIIEITDNNADLLKRCLSPDLFCDAADAIAKDNKEHSLNIYKGLLVSCTSEKGLRLRILYSLKKLLPAVDMFPILNTEETLGLTPDYKKKIENIRLSLLLDILYALPPDSPEIEVTANKIFVINPKEDGARFMLAWMYFNRKDFEHAFNEFDKLYKRNPMGKDYAYGLALTFVKLKRYDEALNLIHKYKDIRLASIETEIKIVVLGERLKILPPDSPEIEDIAKQILALKPEESGTRLMLAWAYFNRKDYEHAYNEFDTLCKSNPQDKDFAYGLLLSLIKLKRFDEALDLAHKYKETDERFALVETDIKMSILGEKLAALSPDSPEIEDIARQILAIKPEENGIRLMLAWMYYSNDIYDKSYEEFHILYQRNSLEKEYIYGMALTLRKLGRDVEALNLAVNNKQKDEKLASMVKDICLELANAAYKDKKYKEAEDYYERAFAEDPQDTDVKKLLDLSKYKQTFIAKVLSPIEGLPGDSWGKVTQDLKDGTGIGISFYITQGIDWVKLPGDIILNTYGEYMYSNRTNQALYFAESGEALGIDLQKSIFKLGVEYYWQNYTVQNKNYTTNNAYFKWYKDWSKYMGNRAEDSGFSINALSGETYGKVIYDFNDAIDGTGIGVSGFINEGIDWVILPGGITLNTHAEFRWGFRTNNNLYYNSLGPALVIELQKLPFRLGMEYYWDRFTMQNVTQRSLIIYLIWHLDWDLKPKE